MVIPMGDFQRPESCGCHCRYCLASFSPRSLLPMVSILFVAPYSKPGSRLLSGHVMQWIFHWVADSAELLFVWQSHLPWLAPCNSCTYLQRSAPGINATPVERGAEYITTSLAYTRKKTSLALEISARSTKTSRGICWILDW